MRSIGLAAIVLLASPAGAGSVLDAVTIDSERRFLALVGRGVVGRGGVLPEPGTLVLVGLGLMAVFYFARRKWRRHSE